MDKLRVPLYERLPEIYRIKDEEQKPPGQLQSYLALVERAFGAIHENIEALYDDLFIETCDDWVIPYIGDLLGTSHLTGDPWTLRADVADTVALRRRKGTLASIERLTYNLTQWGVHCVELRENLVWNQHLNHQRPDAGGDPPYGLSSVTKFTPIRGGTVTLRDPAMLSLLDTPFDPFAHVADVKPPAFGSVGYNLPNLAIFLWRLEDYRVRSSRPLSRGVHPTGATVSGEATHVARFDIHPLGEPVRLFNTYQFDPDREPPVVTRIDETPGPIPRSRLTEGSEAGNPEEYLAVDTYDPADNTLASRDISDVGLQLHLPEPEFAGEPWPGLDPEVWSIRGANLCAWESGVQPPLQDREIVIDPDIGRIIVGVGSQSEGDALEESLLLTYTYGAVGPVGAHPKSRAAAPKEWKGEPVDSKEVDFHEDPDGLRKALDDIHLSNAPVLIEIKDSMVHELDLSAVAGVVVEDGHPNLSLNRSLIIRAADGQRPIIELEQPLRFRPKKVKGADVDEQKELDAVVSNLTVRLEGLFITGGATGPLIARAALHSLEIVECTLDPGGHRKLDGTRAPIRRSLDLRESYGFTDSDEEDAFKETPGVILQRTVAGPLLIDGGYHLSLADSIIDAGKGVGDDPQDSFAVSGATDPTGGWGPPAEVNGITVFGRMRVESINGRGGIWVHALEVLDNQKGCIRFSYFSGEGDRLPQNLGCVSGTGARLRFVGEIFGEPTYGQLAHTTDFRIRERGPKDDAMGAFGFLLEAHKWRNIQIRYREFMPVGVKPLLVPVT
jgi:hypothetical protein